MSLHFPVTEKALLKPMLSSHSATCAPNSHEIRAGGAHLPTVHTPPFIYLPNINPALLPYCITVKQQLCVIILGTPVQSHAFLYSTSAVDSTVLATGHLCSF